MLFRALFVALICSQCLMAEHPSCYLNVLAIQGTSADTIRLQLRDQDNPGAVYTGHIYADDPTYSSTTDSVTVVSSGGTGVYTIDNGVFGTGTKNLRDGAQHTLYLSMDTYTQGKLTNCSGDGWPYKYYAAGEMDDYTYALYNSARASATAANLALIANVKDPYSIGTSGKAICTVAGTAIRNDGVVGYYAAKYGVPCSHVHTISTAVSELVTATQIALDYATLTPVLAADEQFIALGWMLPDEVTNIVSEGTAGTLTNTKMSMPGFFANNGSIVSSRTITTSGAVAVGDSVTGNPYFHSGSDAPFSDFGIRPAFMLAYAKCNGGGSGVRCANGTNVGSAPGDWSADFATAQTGVDATFAARGTNPRGGQIYMNYNSGDFTRSSGYLMASLRGYGGATTVTPSALKVTTTAIVSNSQKVTGSGILGFELASANPDVTSTPGFVASGVGYFLARTSASGQLGGTNQAPATLYTLYGAAFSCGTVDEPFGMISTKYPEMFLLMSAYTRGATAVEAAWKATRDPWTMVCVGDPLAAPFSLSRNRPISGGRAR